MRLPEDLYGLVHVLALIVIAPDARAVFPALQHGGRRIYSSGGF
jgi:hypothetical protein